MASLDSAYSGNHLYDLGRGVNDPADSYLLLSTSNAVPDLSGEKIVVDAKQALEKYREYKTELQQVKEELRLTREEKTTLISEYEELRKRSSKLNLRFRDSTILSKYDDYHILMTDAYNKKKEEYDTTIRELEDRRASLTVASQSLFQMFREGVELTEEEREALVDPNKCAICIERKIALVFNPCGHTICRECSDAERLDRCHICRKFINTKIRIYYS